MRRPATACGAAANRVQPATATRKRTQSHEDGLNCKTSCMKRNQSTSQRGRPPRNPARHGRKVWPAAGSSLRHQTVHGSSSTAACVAGSASPRPATATSSQSFGCRRVHVCRHVQCKRFARARRLFRTFTHVPPPTPALSLPLLPITANPVLLRHLPSLPHSSSRRFLE